MRGDLSIAVHVVAWWTKLIFEQLIYTNKATIIETYGTFEGLPDECVVKYDRFLVLHSLLYCKSDCFETQIFALSCNMKYFLPPNNNPPVSTLLQEFPTAIEQEMVDE